MTDSKSENVKETTEVIEGDFEEEVHEDGTEELFEEEAETVSLSSRILKGLAILAIGGFGALWAGPKIAPLLPQGLSPVAEFFAPQSFASDEIAALKSELEAKIDKATSNSELVDGLNQKIANLESKDAEAAKVVADLNANIDSLNAAIETTQKELSDISARQAVAAAGGTADEETLKAFEEKLAAIATAQQKLNQSQALAVEAQQDASVKLKTADTNGKLEEIAKALNSGGSFENILTSLTTSSGLSAPQTLAAVSKSGAASVVDLKKQLPELARKALREDAAANSGTDVLGKFTSFLKSQVGTRSLEPQDGDELDAVLSRIESALDAQDIKTATALTDKLGAPANIVLADWISSLQELNTATSEFEIFKQQVVAAQ